MAYTGPNASYLPYDPNQPQPQASNLPNAPLTPPQASPLGTIVNAAPQYAWNAGTYSSPGAPPPQGGGFTQGSMDQSGITGLNNVHFTWDEFNGLPSSQQKAILGAMGMSSDDQSKLLSTLQKTEMAQYAEYQAEHAPQGQADSSAGGGFWHGVANYLNPWSYWQGGHVPNLPASIRQADTSAGKMSLADIQKQSGLTDLINNYSLQAKAAQASGATDPQQQGGSPAYSQANLNAYTNAFLLPFLNHVNSMVQGDMSQWSGAINNLKGLGLPGSVAADLSPTSGEKALYQTLAPLMAQQQWTAPYVGQVNQIIGANQAYGAKLAEQGANIQTLIANGVLQPGPGAFGGTGGIGGLTSGSGNSLIPSVNSIVNTLTPSQQPTPTTS